MKRRPFLLALLAPTSTPAQPKIDSRPLVFPRDFGAHPEFGIEWWYATGELRAGGDVCGFQATFFRARTGIDGEGAFAPRQLLFAHAAVTDLATRRLLHAQRIARWNGDPHAPLAAAANADTAVHIGDWRFVRDGGPALSRYRTRLRDRDAGFAFDLVLAATQPVLLQGDAGYSRKGPAQASRYYSEPQLEASGTLVRGTRRSDVRGVAWLDHEWSDSVMPPEAVGWDWIGMNLDDGGALMAFRLRRTDGTSVWAGGTFRPAGGAARAFGPDEVRFIPGRSWTSGATGARYPVQWSVETPVGRWQVRARLDAQELDSRASTGTAYWEGLSDLLDAAGRVVGRGYLEMTGYAGRLAL